MKNDFFEEFRMKNHIKNARFLFKKHQKQFEKVLIDAEKRTNRYPEQFIIWRDEEKELTQSVTNQHALYVFTALESIREIEIILKDIE